MSQKAEKRWECFATLRKEMNELADEIIEWSADGHYRDRLIQLYDLADTVFGAKNVKRLLIALEELESQLQSGFTPEARAQEERAEKAEQDSKELEESLGVANAATQVWKERAKAAEQKLAALPADWSKDSSLETWFPFTAERLAELEQRLQQPIRQLHAEWSDATFGNVGPVGPLKHLSKEALEAAAAPQDLSEWADMLFLFWDAQRRAGITDEQINQAMIEKLAVNKARSWPEPKDGEPRLHINVEGE